MITIRGTEELARLEQASRVVLETLDEIEKAVAPGVTTDELDAIAAEEIRKRAARPAFLNYRGFPKTICTSVNEEVVHGIPGIRPGKKTADYIDTVLSRLTILGAVYLTFVALLPDFLARGFRFASLPWIGARLETMLPRFFSEGFGFNFYFGGTSLLIVVGVAMDTVQQVESKLVEHHYTGFLKKSRIRGRRT